MADAKKYWIGPGNLRVEKGIVVQEGGELTKQVQEKLGKDRMAELVKAGSVGEKIAAVSAAGRPTKEVTELKALIEAKDKVIAELQAENGELKADISGKGGDK